MRKFWAAKGGGRSSSLGVRRVSGAHPGGFREAPHKQNQGPNAAVRGSYVHVMAYSYVHVMTYFAKIKRGRAKLRVRAWTRRDMSPQSTHAH